ncbi:hypothetical protein D9M72_583050 [compost metagenome]
MFNGILNQVRHRALNGSYVGADAYGIGSIDRNRTATYDYQRGQIADYPFAEQPKVDGLDGCWFSCKPLKIKQLLSQCGQSRCSPKQPRLAPGVLRQGLDLYAQRCNGSS